jgi:hypothetical protein
LNSRSVIKRVHAPLHRVGRTDEIGPRIVPEHRPDLVAIPPIQMVGLAEIVSPRNVMRWNPASRQSALA